MRTIKEAKTSNYMNSETEKAQALETRSFEARLSLLDVEMLYRSMLVRLTKRYSPEEMSFLIGEQPLFIGKMEELQRVQACMSKLWENYWLVNEFGSSFLMPNSPVEEEMGNYQLVKTTYADRTMYQMNKLCEHGKKEKIFLLKDDNHAVDKCPKSTKQEEDALQIAIQALIDLNYLENERSSHQLFMRCQPLIYDPIKPKNLFRVLTAFIKQKSNPRLKRVKSKYLGYGYVAVNESSN
jgi:hypothetical protein